MLITAAGEIYRKIYLSSLWKSLSAEDKAELLDNDENLTVNAKKIKEDIESKAQDKGAVRQEVFDALSKLVPSPLTAEAMISKLPPEQLKQLKDAAKAETDRYLSSIMMPAESVNEMFASFEHPQDFYGDDEISAEDALPKLPRFTKRQRANRKAASAAVRGALIDFIAWSFDNSASLPSDALLLRTYATLCTPENTQKNLALNEEIKWLFAPSSSKYKEQWDNKYNEIRENYDSDEAAKAAVDGAFASRRGEIIMTRLHGFSRLLNQTDALCSPSLPPAEFAKNIQQLICAKNVISDAAKDFGAAADSGFIRLSDNDKAFLSQVTNNDVLFAGISKKIEVVANPLYEHFDIDYLRDCSLYPFFIAQVNLSTQRKDNWKRAHADEPNFSLYTSGERDLFANMIFDADSYSNYRGRAIEIQRQEFLSNYSFMPRYLTTYRETLSDGSHPKDQPIAYVQGDRVLILRQSRKNEALTAEQPESLFNSTLASTTADCARPLLDTDPWYVLNHSRFRTLKRKLRRVQELSPLRHNFTAEDLNNANQRFTELYDSCASYLESKTRGANRLNAREKQRVDAARRLKTYAELKLKELTLVQRARATQLKYAGLTPAEIRSATASENRRSAKASIRDIDNEQRLRNPGRWLKEMYCGDTKLPAAFSNFSLDLLMLGQNWTDGHLKDNLSKYNEAMVTQLIGTAIAAELILQERSRAEEPDAMGEMETFVTENRQSFRKLVTRLGEQALTDFSRKIHGKNAPDFSTMTIQDKTDFLLGFDPRDNIEKSTAAFNAVRCEITMTGKYINSIPRNAAKKDAYYAPFAEYTQHSIVDEATAIAANPSHASAERLENLLSSCILHGMIARDKRAHRDEDVPGQLEQLFSPNKAQDIARLRQWIKKSSPFLEIREQCTDANGRLSAESVTNYVRNGIPDDVAQRCAGSLKVDMARQHRGETDLSIAQKHTETMRKAFFGDDVPKNNAPQAKNGRRMPPSNPSGPVRKN